MTPKTIDINDWVIFGEGGNGQAFNHKSDNSIFLKLNREDMPAERAEREYVVTKSVHESGIACPAVYEYVTDGRRTGVICQRMIGKKSFARMISEDKSMLEPLAREFAVHSKAFHETECDTRVFESFKEKTRAAFESCAALPQKAKEILLSCLNEMSDATTSLHCDFQPGNIIRSEGKDYWIDLGDFTYGDPDLDMSSLLLLSKFTPSGVVKYLFHISKKEMARFTEAYGAEYYGERWHTPELDAKLDKVLRIKMGLSIVGSPASAKMFLPYIYGNKLKAKMIAKIADIFLTEKVYISKSKNK